MGKRKITTPTPVEDKTKPFTPAPSAPAWFVLVTAPSRERDAIKALTEAGYLAWAPETIVIWSSARRKKRVRINRPLFPRYIFAAPFGPSTTAMTDAKHVVGLVSETPIPGRIIDDLSRRQAGGDFVPVLTNALKQGETVRIEEGPWQGQTGQVDEASPKWVSVLLTVFGAQMPVRFAPEQVSALRAA